MKLEIVVDAQAVLGEGPCWDAVRKVLYWVDIEGFLIHEFNPADHTDRVFPVGQYVGAVVPRESGGLVWVGRDGFYSLNLMTEQLAPLVVPVESIETNRFNDGKCDPAGRFWAGTMSTNGGEKQGTLYRLDLDQTVHPMIQAVTISNGLAWSADAKTLYYIDTPTNCVVAYAYHMETGEIASPRTVITFPQGEGYPDGMTIDEEGMLWVAHWGGWKVSRFDPRTGERIAEISVPAAQVTSCAFGGDHLDELYITTARTGLSQDELDKQPAAGGLFRVRPGVRGTPTFTFGG
ncbi:MAG: SMP-30/gluconolactonase/LRE family protein [Gorillibacterium sp.]|nr:SMP-30/gluconolactonase/LRE family protein [Gorillibacterium sp.]